MVTDLPQQDRFDPEALPVLTAQVICGALVAGVVIFLGVILMQVHGNPPGDPFMAYFAAGFAAMAIVARIIVPHQIERAQMPHADPEAGSTDRPPIQVVANKLYGIFQTQLIIGLAILEGAAFFNVIAYLMSTQVWTLAVVSGLVVLMLMSFPSRDRVVFWIETRLQDLGFDQ